MERFLKRKTSPTSGNASSNIPQASSISSSMAPRIRKDISICSPQEVETILEEIGDDVFTLIIDESSDIRKKKQISVVLRYVDTRGIVKERFVGLVDVAETSALSLKSSIDSLFAEYGLSWKKVRGQSYNGTSTMGDEFNGLKALIMRENSSAYCVHYLAHQLELVIVAVAKRHFGVGNFFDMIVVMTNVVCASCKRKDIVRENQKKKIQEAIGIGETDPERDLNQEFSLIRVRDTWLGFYHNAILHMGIDLFPSIVKVLKYVEEEGDDNLSQSRAKGLQMYFNSFDFVFYLHLMLHVLGITHVLPRALQGEGQSVLNAMILAKTTKQLLQKFRDDGFDSLMKEISSFCEKHDIEMLNIEEDYVNPNNRKQKTNITNRHYYKFDCFNIIVDMQIKEFDDRFNEVSSELLICTEALNPRNSFSQFGPSKLLKMAKLYPDDFGCMVMKILEYQLGYFIDFVREDKRFANLNGIVDLARVMVETRKHLYFALVYRLLKLALVLPVTPATT